jgi:hypothetical protein
MIMNLNGDVRQWSWDHSRSLRLRFVDGVNACLYWWSQASGNVSDIASASTRQSATINGATAANPSVAVGAIPAEAEMPAENRVSFKSFNMGPREVRKDVSRGYVHPSPALFNRWYCEYAFREIRKVDAAGLQLDTLRNRMGGAHEMHRTKCMV